jgi:hypothetical protein
VIPFGPAWRRSRAAAPAEAAGVLLASAGKRFSDQAVRSAVAAAHGERILVLSTARIYGTAFGLQNPGLLPTKREWAEQVDLVEAAVKKIRRAGGPAKGEVIATRDAVKTFIRAAQRHSVRCVVLQASEGGRLRRLIEGDPAARMRRRLGSGVEVKEVGRGIARA